MTVSITISGQSSGDPLEEVIALGEVQPGSASDVIDLYIRHDAVAWQITDCAFYLVRYTGLSYDSGGGTGTPDADFSTVIGWGDTTIALNPNANGVGPLGSGGITDPEYGGFYLNMDHAGNISNVFPPDEWHPLRSGYGDSPENAVILSQDAINNTGPSWTPTDGEIPYLGEAHVQVRWDLPVSLESAGTYFTQLVMTYSYTS